MKNYLLSIIAAGIICAITGILFPNKDTIEKIVGLMCGLFMTLIVLSPIKKINPVNWGLSYEFQSDQSKHIAEQGQYQAEETLREVITEYCSTYIVEKAKGMGVDIDVQFQLNSNDPPVPTSAVITGTVSPYAKAKLKNILTQDLGIPEDRQQWS